MLRLELLGTPNLTVSGRAVKLGAKHISMLAYLALEGRTSRRALGNILWTDAPNALNNISVARNLVVKALGKAALEVDADSLALGENVACDVLEWREGAARVDPGVWTLWRGGFLTGLRLTDWEMGLGAEFEDWLFTTRETLNLERREFAMLLGRKELEASHFAAAISFLEVAQGISSDPNEDASCLLMLCLGVLKEFVAADAVYAQLSKVLLEELGVEPTTQSRTAFELVRTRDANACRVALEAQFQKSKPELARAATTTPFVGRAEQLQTLTQHFKTTQTRVAVIRGEPGAGKSRLAEELAARVSSVWQVVRGVCPMNGLYLGAFEVLAKQNLPYAKLSQLPAQWQDALARFIPDVLQTQNPALSPDLERRALFYAFKSLIFSNENTFFILDDLQWADAASLEFLHFLLEQPVSLALVLTQRNTENSLSDVMGLIASMQKREILCSLELGGLEENALKDLGGAFNFLGDLNTLLQRSGGNPFYALELMRAGGGSVSRVHDLVRSRLAALPEIARQSLEALAVLGNDTSLNLIRKVAGRSLEETSEALDVLERAALLVSGATIRFAHDIVRESVEQVLTGTRAALLNLRAAKNTQKALHYLAAKNAWDDDDILAARAAFLNAGNLERLHGNLDAALVWYNHALEISSDHNELQVRLEMANALERFGVHKRALEELNLVREKLVSLPDAILLARIETQLGFILHREYQESQKAQEALQRALNALEQLESREAQLTRSDALFNLGVIASAQDQFEVALAYYTQAYQIRLELNDTARVADSLGGIGYCKILLRHDDAQSTLEACLQLRQKIGDEVGVSRVLTSLAVLAHDQGNFSKALDYQQQVLHLQKHFGNPRDLADTLYNLFFLEQELGHLEKAKHHLQQAVILLEQHEILIPVHLVKSLAAIKKQAL
jgi:tetratricopeptide (TPR) repeat protein/DNA-binding SARP family transcriptional activator